MAGVIPEGAVDSVSSSAEFPQRVTLRTPRYRWAASGVEQFERRFSPSLNGTSDVKRRAVR